MMPAGPTSQAPPRIGLALGGGGARGLAHIHVIAALDDLGLKPAAIVGTSIGAIFGAAAAAGLAGADIAELTLAALGRPAEVWSKIWRLRPRHIGHVLEAIPLFDPQATLEAFLPAAIPADFAELAIPFAAIAADFYGVREVELRTGRLRPAIAASIALPAVFQPMAIDGMTLIDGGVVNPLPFDRLPADVTLTIAVDVVGVPVRPEARAMPNMREALFGATQLLMQSVIAEKLKSRRPDILIRPPVDHVYVLDFLKAREILDATAVVRDEVKYAIAAELERA